MGMSVKTKLFRVFVGKRMKKYVGRESVYIRKRMQGQNFDLSKGESRKSYFRALAGYSYNRQCYNGVNAEFLFAPCNSKVSNDKKKIVYVLHGGAYHAAMSDLYCGVMEWYSDGKRDVVAIDYRTAPKNPYPAALDDAVAFYQVLLNMQYRPENIIVAGDSAGGGLALAMALKLREMGIEIPKTYILSSPWVDLNAFYSPLQKSDDVLFGWGNVIEMCADAYAGGADKTNPLISPIYGSMDVFSGCRVYISVAEGEMLEHQGTVLAANLGIVGADVTFDKLRSGVHDVITMYMLKSRECKDAWNRIYAFMNREVE